MSSSSPRMKSARLWFCVFVLLAVAIVAAQAQPASGSRAASAVRPAATTRGPLFHYVVDAARGLENISRAAVGGKATD